MTVSYVVVVVVFTEAPVSLDFFFFEQRTFFLRERERERFEIQNLSFYVLNSNADEVGFTRHIWMYNGQDVDVCFVRGAEPLLPLKQHPCMYNPQGLNTISNYLYFPR